MGITAPPWVWTPSEGFAPVEELDESSLGGLRLLKPMRRLLARLHACAPHPNRRLFYDEYVLLELLFFFTPAMRSLRHLQQVSAFPKVQQALGVRRMSLGSMSESVRLFDPALLEAVFEEMARGVGSRPYDARLKELRLLLTVVDSSFFEALPKMAWALQSKLQGVKCHLHYDLDKQAPVALQVKSARSSDRAALKERLGCGRLYLLDRGYVDFDLLQQVLFHGSSFVVRLPSSVGFTLLEERPVSGADVAAGITSDRLVRLGTGPTQAKLHRPVRLLEALVPGPLPRPRRSQAKPPPMRLVIGTDLLDWPAELIVRLYRWRWQIELFFRALKHVLDCRHWLSASREGVAIQLYAALIAALLLGELTGAKLNKQSHFLLAMYLQGWLDETELFERLGPSGQGALSKKA